MHLNAFESKIILVWSLTFVTYLIFSNLLNQTQRAKIEISYNDKSNIEYGIPQGSILGPLLFNIDLIDLFFEYDDSEIASYTDDTTPYSCVDDIPSVITQLQSTASKLFF